MTYCCNSTGHRKVASSGSAFFGFLPTSPSLFRSMTMSGTRHGLLSPSITSPLSSRRRSSVSGGERVTVCFCFCSVFLFTWKGNNYFLCQLNLLYLILKVLIIGLSRKEKGGFINSLPSLAMWCLSWRGLWHCLSWNGRQSQNSYLPR